MKRIAIITGGSSGIGKATAALFADKGYIVYELSRRNTEHNNPNIRHLTCDVTDEDNVRNAVNHVVGAENQIDLLISNAGFGISGPIEFTDSAEAKRQFDVNFFGTHNIIRAVLPQMRLQHFGKIIITSSVAAVLSIPYQAFYSASKSALNALCLALRNEVADFGIKVSAIMPGDVSTNFTDARQKNDTGSDIYTHTHKAVSAMEHDERNGMTTMQLAKKIYSIAQKSNPAPLYTAGLQYHIFIFLEKILPKRFSNWIVGLLYK